MRDHEQEEPLKLPDAARYVFEECRMILPGIQALFGFQMIAIFNSGFSEKLSVAEQKLHNLAILLVVVAVALIMSPAALHRRAEQRSVSDRFIRIASRFVLSAMLLLAIGISLEVFIVTDIVWHDRFIATTASVAVLCLFTILWELYPTIYRRTRSDPKGGPGDQR
jgi:uncharacterized protein DUF6328